MSSHAEVLGTCPVCGGSEWYDDWPHPDHRYSYCERCDWSPPMPMSVEEYRAEWQTREALAGDGE